MKIYEQKEILGLNKHYQFTIYIRMGLSIYMYI